MTVLSDRRIIANLKRRMAMLEKECARLRRLLEIARQHLRQSPAADAQYTLDRLNGIIE